MAVETKTVKLSEIKPNPDNPRVIKDDDFKALVKSLKELPEMTEAREVVVNKDMVILGGNMRYRAMQEAGWKECVVKIVDWAKDKQREFIIKDNINRGDWDYDLLANEWDIEELEAEGLRLPTIKNTELLSGLEYESAYYEPEQKPSIKLEDCIDLDIYNKKLEVISKAKLPQEQKEVLRLLAQRFIKIDFENVANYYYFNASEEEQTILERLRVVLTDNGANGFIEDDLIRIMSLTEQDDKW